MKCYDCFPRFWHMRLFIQELKKKNCSKYYVFFPQCYNNHNVMHTVCILYRICHRRCCSIAANSLCLILSSFSCFIAATLHTCRRYLELLQHCGEFLVFSSQFFPLFYNSHINVVITWSCCSIAANSLSLVLSSFHCCIAAT